MDEYEVVENPGFIRIDSTMLKTKIESLKNEKNTIEEVLDKFSSDINGMDSYWSGTTADKISGDLKNYISGFVNINNKLNSYIDFLQSVVDKYEYFDNYINEKINDGKGEE